MSGQGERSRWFVVKRASEIYINSQYSLALITRRNQMLSTILIVILILMLMGAMPRWPHSRNWGYAPSGGLGLVLLILIILLLLGRLPF